MAKYNRNILVPYLRDVCSAEMLCGKLEKDIHNLESRLSETNSELRRVQNLQDPVKPQRTTSYDGVVSFSILLVLGGWLALKGIMLLFSSGIGLLPLLIFAPGALMFYGGAFGFWENYQKDERKYESECTRYKAIRSANQRAIDNVPNLEQSRQQDTQRLNQCREEYQKAKQIRGAVYSANIIPSKYRTPYMAYYLYDYFNTSREDDLDKIIQTCLLDDIRKAVYHIMDQMEEVLLNQRYSIALEEGRTRAIQQNHHQQMEQLARMEKNQEKQLDYQHMIEANQRVTNYFLASDYIRNLR